MRILHIVTTMNPEGGGPQEAVRMLLRYSPAGYENEIATLDPPTAPFLPALQLPIHALGTGQSGRLPLLTGWLRANRDRFDGVLLHGLWGYGDMAVRRAIAGHKPYVVFVHGMLDPYFKRAFPAKHAKKWLFWLLNDYWLLRRAFRVLFTTRAERDLAKRSFWLAQWNAKVVPLGAEPPPYEPDIARAAFLRLCPKVAGRRFLLFLGRIDPKKGCDLLIDAFSSVRDLDPDLHLVVAGPGPAEWRSKLMAAAERGGVAGRIHWPGMLKHEAKWGAFVAAEAFILPSHQENFGIAVVESLACGRPVLITHPVNISPDLAADGCALVEPDSPEGIRRLLERWIAASRNEREQLSARALTTFETRYDMRKNAPAIMRVFDELVSSAASVEAR